jgi:hypothetical protein
MSRKSSGERSEALAAWFPGDGPIRDDQLDAFLAQLPSAPDPKAAQAAVAELIASPRIDLAQLERIARSDPRLMRRHEALIQRTYLRRRLDEEVSDELLQRVVDLGDAAIQTALIRDPRLSRKQAKLLASQGVNPTIRDRAEAWFQDKKHWK